MRNCPVCNIQLDEKQLESEIVDICSSCGGIFFDKGELESIVHLVEIFQQIKLSEPEIDTVSQKEYDREFLCPECGVIMEKRDYSGIYIDFCRTCEGIWLDNEEINALKLAEQHVQKNIELYKRLGNDA